MAILKPQIQEALRTAGLTRGATEDSTKEALENAGLGLSETLQTIEHLMSNGTPHIQLRAAETVMKAHGLMKDQQAPMPSITIVINDPESSFKVNPILLPRELNIQPN